jgi:hypothetical protein
MTKRKITTRVILDGAVDHIFTRMRQVYTDTTGEYVNCDRSKRYIVNDSYDIVYITGKAITFAELADKIKQHFGVEE